VTLQFHGHSFDNSKDIPPRPRRRHDESRRNVGAGRHFDYYVATTRYGLHLNYPQTRIAAVIERDGAVFTVIRGGCRPAYP